MRGRSGLHGDGAMGTNADVIGQFGTTGEAQCEARSEQKCGGNAVSHVASVMLGNTETNVHARLVKEAFRSAFQFLDELPLEV